MLLVGISLPCVVAGLCEDLTALVSPQVRLAGRVLSAGLLIVIHGTVIDRIGVEPLESMAPLMAMLSLVAVLSIKNGINLIDGLNGLAGGSALLMYLALGALSIATVQRNAEVSPWFAVLLLAYPLTEVAFTVWRRALRRRRPISKADAASLQRSTGSLGYPHDARNAIASALLWCFPRGSSRLATVYYANTAALVICLLAFVPVYLRLYFRIAQFRTPFRLSPPRQA